MNNTLVQVKVLQRLNKLSSGDYQNIECWMIAEAFNKAMDSWVSRQLEGINQTKSTAEGSIRSIDKLQAILIQGTLAMTDQGDYWEASLPSDYLEWSRISAKAEANCYPPRALKIYLVEEANIDIINADNNLCPSFEWAETVATVIGDSIRIYTNDCFDINSPTLTYYRTPLHIQILNCVNPDTGAVVTTDIECQFSDSVIETIIDEAAAILADDMDNYNKMQVLNQNAERNN